MHAELVINLKLQTGHYDLCGSTRKCSSVRVTAVMINLESLVTHKLPTLFSSNWTTHCIDHHTVFIIDHQNHICTLLHKEGQQNGYIKGSKNLFILICQRSNNVSYGNKSVRILSCPEKKPFLVSLSTISFPENNLCSLTGSHISE